MILKGKEARQVTMNGPDPRAAARGLVALVLDQTRIDPDRRPSPDMRRWCRELATRLGVPPREVMDSNRELLQEALRLEQVAHLTSGADSVPPERILDGLLQEAATAE